MLTKESDYSRTSTLAADSYVFEVERDICIKADIRNAENAAKLRRTACLNASLSIEALYNNLALIDADSVDSKSEQLDKCDVKCEKQLSEAVKKPPVLVRKHTFDGQLIYKVRIVWNLVKMFCKLLTLVMNPDMLGTVTF